MGELAREGSVAETVGVGVMCHVLYVSCHVTILFDFSSSIIWLRFYVFFLVFVLLLAHIKRFSVSRVRDSF